MKFQCPHCTTSYDHRKAHTGQKAKCKQCGHLFRIAQTIELTPAAAYPSNQPSQPIIETAGVALVGVVARGWNKAPAAFRTAFLSTLGVLSALMITWFIYGKLPQQNNPIQNKPAQTLDSVSSQLATCGLYPDMASPRSGIFRGRILKEYRFLPDANYGNDYLSVWMDESQRIVGISMVWISGGFSERMKCIFFGFMDLCDYAGAEILSEPMKKSDSAYIASIEKNGWLFVLIKKNVEKIEVHTLIAQNW
jgi:predicted Zn finger-like uncharacterized protein